jgi:hypothetical protein
MSRSAQSSYKGYTYQRARLLNLIFCKYYNDKEKLNLINFSEEHLEDIDFYIMKENDNVMINLYQGKYLNTNDNESLIESSGLTKVLISHYDNNKINNIYYEVVSTTGKIEFTNRLNFFYNLIKDNNNNNLIGKFICLNYCDGKIENLFKKTYDYNIYLQYIKDYKNNDICELINKKFIKINAEKNDTKKIINKSKTKKNIIKDPKNTEDLKITTDTEKIEDETNINKLKKFCEFCIDMNNTQKLINYLKKINIDITNKTFDVIHKETIDALKKILPEFNNICTYMSKNYNDFFSETLYGLFEMMIVKNLFLNNNRMTIQTLIDKIKLMIKKSMTDNDKIILVIYTIKHFINENKYDIIKTNLFNNNYIVNFILINKITMSSFIKECCNAKIDDKNKNIQCLVRQIIYQIILNKQYIFVDDNSLLSFLYRTHKNLKLNGSKYNSLKKIDELIINNSSDNNSSDNKDSNNEIKVLNKPKKII